MRARLEAPAHAGKLQMRSVVAPFAQSVVSLVINLRQSFPPLCVRPDPDSESLPDFSQLGLRAGRFGVIDNSLLFAIDQNQIVDRRLAQVQSVINKMHGIAPARPPRLRSFDRLQREMIGVGDRPRAKLLVVLRVAFVTRQQFADEVRDDISRNPAGTEPCGDLFLPKRRRHDAFERLNVPGKSRIQFRGGFGFTQFQADIA